MIPNVTERIAWEEIVNHEQRHRELLKEANRQRLVQQVLKNETTFYQLLLGQLGEQLVKWGCRLQAKYGVMTKASKGIYHVEMLHQ